MRVRAGRTDADRVFAQFRLVCLHEMGVICFLEPDHCGNNHRIACSSFYPPIIGLHGKYNAISLYF